MDTLHTQVYSFVYFSFDKIYRCFYLPQPDLGIRSMALYEPTVATKKASFGMS